MLSYKRPMKKSKIHIKVVTAKALIAVFCVILATCACVIGITEGGVAEVFLLSKSRKIPIYSVDKAEKVVALTFDAAYGSDKTEQILDILEEYNATATFFLVGFWVDKYNDLTKEISERGFEIGTHSNMHEHMSKMSETAISSDLSLSVKKIEDTIGKKVEVFRPPYGEYNNTLIEVADKLSLFSIQWSVDSLDWKGLSADTMVSRVVSRIHEGAIVLFHNNSDHIVEALPRILELLKARGYTFSTVGDLIYRDGYKIDNNGKQIKNA